MKEMNPIQRLLNEVSEITKEWIRENVLKEDFGELTPLLEHALTSVVPGNDRALLVKLGCELREKDMDIALPGMAAWELLNINLLVTDDFFDQRTTRRMGVDTIRNKWGDEACISLGFIIKSLASEVLISAYSKTSPWSLQDALGVLERATKWSYYSQFQENELAKKPLSEITLSMYMALIKNATSSGIAGAFELGCVMGGGNKKERKKFKDFGMALGDLSQIRDDLIDYIYNEALIRKGPFNDLFAKKRRLPLLVAYWEGTSQEKKQIDEILKKDQVTLEDAFVVVEMITSLKVERKIRNIVKEIESNVKRKLFLLPNIRPAKYFLLELVELFSDL